MTSVLSTPGRCVLKPGYGRWVGMQQAVSENFGALSWALWDQPRCGEPGAHPTYCIAKPRGLGAVADSMGKVLPTPRPLPAAPYLLHPTPCTLPPDRYSRMRRLLRPCLLLPRSPWLPLLWRHELWPHVLGALPGVRV